MRGRDDKTEFSDSLGKTELARICRDAPQGAGRLYKSALSGLWPR